MTALRPFALIVADGTLDKLQSGEMLPRVGDFVGSQIASSYCGIVRSIGKMGHKSHEIAVFIVQGHPLGKLGQFSILENDIRFLAPFETDLDDGDDMT